MRVRWCRRWCGGFAGPRCSCVCRPSPPGAARAALIRVAVLAEDVVRVGQIALLRVFRRSTTPLLIPFVGHGSPQRVGLGGRVVLGRPEARARRLPATDGGMLAPARGPVQEPTRRSRRSVLRTSLARFLTVEVATRRSPPARRAPSSPSAATATATSAPSSPTRGSRPAGTTSSSTSPTGRPSARPSSSSRRTCSLGLVSDVDDTILETALTRGLEFLRITLLTEVTDRAPLPGAAALYRALVCRSGEAGLPVFYLSTSPWNLHEMLLEFIALRGFPFGPLLLTDWGPGRGNLFRIGSREHKLGLIRRILAEHPELCAAAGRRHRAARPRDLRGRGARHPGRIRAIYVRRTGALNAPRGRGGRARRRDHRRRRADAGRRRQCRDRRACRLAGAPGRRAGRRGAPRDPPGRPSRVPWRLEVVRPRTGSDRRAGGGGCADRAPSAVTSAFSALPGDHRPW